MNTRIAAVLASMERNKALLTPPQKGIGRNFTWKRARCPLLTADKFDPVLIHARFIQALRSRTHSATKQRGASKTGKTVEMLGCSIQEFRAHLTAQFKDGMSWENYGEWEIDHIKPCRAFDLRDPEQQKLCFHYSNLQPMWADENKRKSDKVNGLRARELGYLA